MPNQIAKEYKKLVDNIKSVCFVWRDSCSLSKWLQIMFISSMIYILDFFKCLRDYKALVYRDIALVNTLCVYYSNMSYSCCW